MENEKIESFKAAVAYILDQVRFNTKGNTLRGTADYKQGFKDGYAEVLGRVEGCVSNYSSMIWLQEREKQRNEAAKQRQQQQQ